MMHDLPLAIAAIALFAVVMLIAALAELAKAGRLRQPLASGQRRHLARAVADVDERHWRDVQIATCQWCPDSIPPDVSKDDCKCPVPCGMEWCNAIGATA